MKPLAVLPPPSVALPVLAFWLREQAKDHTVKPPKAPRARRVEQWL